MDWETLVFDFTNEVPETPALDLSQTYDKASMFFNFGTSGTGEAYYWDDVEFVGGAAETARVQVIHNSADAAAAVVDVWLNDILLLDDFAFRTASPFVDAPAGEEFTISIKGPDSQDPNDPIWSMNYTLEAGETYVLVANGIVSETGYDPNQPFDINVYGMGREAASQPGNIDMLVHHGSTDAPTVDVVEIGAGAGTIADNLMYSDFQGYVELPASTYVLDIRDETGENSIVAYQVPSEFLELEGKAVVTLASGFLNPENNSNGPAFGMFLALPTGGPLEELPPFIPGNARVQVIHNSADAAAAVVDVWLNETLLLDDFAFRTASPFVDAPTGVNLTIAIKGPDSENPDNPIWSNNYVLEDGKTYVLVANGIVSETGYDPATPFDIYVNDMGRENAIDGITDVLVFHGSTDAPTVDVVETGVGAGTIVDDISYGEYDGYLELPTADYELSITDETGETTVAVYAAPLETLGLNGAALVTVASGFLTPANNSDGPAFGLWVALPAGGPLVELPNITSVGENQADVINLTVYPNPASDVLNIPNDVEYEGITIYGINGQVVYQTDQQVNLISLDNFQPGVYTLSASGVDGKSYQARFIVK
jgi:hypothetical protein